MVNKDNDRFKSAFEMIIRSNNSEEDNLINITSGEFLELVSDLYNDQLYRDRIIKNSNVLIRRCANNFNLDDYISLLFLHTIPELKENVNDLFDKTTKLIFNKKTLIFLFKIFKLVKNNELDINNIYDYIINELQKKDSLEASIILFDLFLFVDFRKKIKDDYPLIYIIISSYINFDNDIVSNDLFKGSSIIGCILKDNNEELIMPYVKKLLQNKKLIVNNMKMIGGGSTSLVFMINDLVLKIGESRHNKYVYGNHRILESLTRDFITRNDKDLFCVEVMKKAKVGDVTEAERDELVADLRRQGLIWDDTKLENCGVLYDDDTNDSYFVDSENIPETVLHVVDNSVDREEFSKRKRRVVVIDNDLLGVKPGGIGK